MSKSQRTRLVWPQKKFEWLAIEVSRVTSALGTEPVVRPVRREEGSFNQVHFASPRWEEEVDAISMA